MIPWCVCGGGGWWVRWDIYVHVRFVRTGRNGGGWKRREVKGCVCVCASVGEMWERDERDRTIQETEGFGVWVYTPPPPFSERTKKRAEGEAQRGEEIRGKGASMTVKKLTRSPTTRIERVAVATTAFLSEAFFLEVNFIHFPCKNIPGYGSLYIVCWIFLMLCLYFYLIHN